MSSTAPGTDVDVAILGGGLAGLTLALQLQRRDPSLRITVIERHRHPVREGAFKVGESTVEIGAHYFAHVLGLRQHLDEEHIRKFGFRFFFSRAWISALVPSSRSTIASRSCACRRFQVNATRSRHPA